MLIFILVFLNFAYSIFKRHMKTRSSRVNNAHETRLKHVEYAFKTRGIRREYAFKTRGIRI
jgi:hypothetical protein